MARLFDEVLQVALDNLNHIMITGLRIRCTAIEGDRAYFQLSLVDDKGDDIVEVAHTSLRPHDTATMPGLQRALNVTFG